MKIRFKKLSDDQHEIEIIRADGRTENSLCNTRNFMKHDLLHFAVESEAGLDEGFWGLLAAGTSLEDLNDRTGEKIAGFSDQIMTIEAVVGSLHNIAEIESLNSYLESLESQGDGLGWEIPEWMSIDFLEKVKEKMRHLIGHWSATKFGDTMDLEWG